MRRRSRAGGEPAKAQRRKTVAPKHRTALRAVAVPPMLLTKQRMRGSAVS